MQIAYTRAMVHAALNGELDEVPTVLDPHNTWTDKDVYDRKARELAALFVKNFEQFLVILDTLEMNTILSAGPKV